MAGYFGYSKSNNAIAAESEKRYPLTEASKILAKALKISQKDAKETLKEIGTTEWHHTGSWYNQTDYYDVESIIQDIQSGEYQIVKAKKPSKEESRFHAVAEWTNWGGSRKHPVAYPQKREVEVIYKGGTFLTLDGQRKKIDNVKLDGQYASVRMAKEGWNLK